VDDDEVDFAFVLPAERQQLEQLRPVCGLRTLAFFSKPLKDLEAFTPAIFRLLLGTADERASLKEETALFRASTIRRRGSRVWPSAWRSTRSVARASTSH
jgi:hypothetical protein